MSGFIRCPSCGFPIGWYAPFYKAAKHSINKKVYDDYPEINPNKLVLSPGLLPPMQDIFDALEITNRCCRMRLFGAADYNEHHA